VQKQKRIPLARVLSKKGYCSRSQAANLIRAGRITLNGRVKRDPETPARIVDEIEIDGSPLDQAPAVYVVMNKPRGVITTASDEKGRDTVYDLLHPDLPWVGPVGRLDKASEGLLVLTNDSLWAARITDPDSHLDKKYHVQVDCIPDVELLSRMTQKPVEPVHDEDGAREYLRAKSARILRHGDKHSWLEITLDEGKNRQIRRLLEALQIRVLRLVRISIGPLTLGTLKKGSTRRLTSEEKKAIDLALRAPLR
jgi:23S rRNA pseudouridine2605 synthase